MIDADWVEAVRDELDAMTEQDVVDHARWFQAHAPPMRAELEAIWEERLGTMERALRSRDPDIRARALDSLKEYCFNEELRRRERG